MGEVDHRVPGKKLDLFYRQDESPVAILGCRRGMIPYRIVGGYIHVRMRQVGFSDAWPPRIISCSLRKRSGRFETLWIPMFPIEDDSNPHGLKPMSCPCRVQIFKKGARSHPDLPIRYSAFGAVHRAEPSGVRHGPMRARAFTQDDAQVLRTPDRIEAKVARFGVLPRTIHADSGFGEFDVTLSTKPAVRAGDDGVRDRAAVVLTEGTAGGGTIEGMVSAGERSDALALERTFQRGLETARESIALPG
ncbi:MULTISPECIES: aminoacyl--tRNA ligase-related protein [Burkholderia]|uniref:threonine--tRNA ligase n=2 Tax=Burkholderia paludis TaxID=1506587 RepID=A0A6J5ELJ3_9BURK|nr:MULTISPECIES: aminoacyl--tRNA ligase-related protein [Burkholderia]CAB3766654.1 Threonine--tRNA ligase [Burkholderia paludis]VWC27048.1 threonyl-tRNA synthetase [Burkholderia paludis]